MRSAAIITAAGYGSRMGLEKNKILLPLNDSTVIETAVRSFLTSNDIQKIIITHTREDKNELQYALKNISIPLTFIEGGSTRQKSVYNGLKHLIDYDPVTVLIHDAARPWISESLITHVLKKAEQTGSAAPVMTSVNAMKKIDDSGKIIEHLQREKTVSAQTPQGFDFKKILEAHTKADAEGYEAIDDTELWDRYFDRVSTVSGEVGNIKITFKKDLEQR
ncbi:MAG: 2-C-methyl-D-erythritol 4-phosphate cytidylyltransferase [Spirochaetaceae bacterium]|jgi:2-C-methyl-D-erythritol 4-phosphate cytidylyltransferase|nr:2-C-methyl-D-erythritol 4-phosphate cytidylyltransferase [Spirochaetaceae bacterium]